MSPEPIETLSKTLGGLGLILRGGFVTEPTDALGETRTVLLVGNAGPDMWRRFTAERLDEPDPLDRWVRRRLIPIAANLGARLAMPSDGPPYLPFQRWAMRAEPVHPSPLGLLIHPEYGLWHAYRAAFLLAEPLEMRRPRYHPPPCETCREKPCLTSCPVDAFSAAGYETKVCAAHLGTTEGADCLDKGCRARRACPVGRKWLADPEQAAFHMAAFLK